MNEQTLFYAIALTQTKGVGPNLAKNLIAYLGSPEAIFKEKTNVLCKIPGIGNSLAKNIKEKSVFDIAENEIRFIEKNKISPIFFTEKKYPFRLKECSDSPILLYTKGTVDLNSHKYISIVGTRNATVYGKNTCEQIICDLKKYAQNFSIISGFAYGIDICAHRSALENNISTLAVLAHGLDRYYPAVHKNTASKILTTEHSGFVTEYISNTTPEKQNFVQRNRIIAGLSDAVIVIESGLKGGSLITAELACSYNRDVFAIPGKIGDKYSAGCNNLIKQNKAALIESAADLLQYMNWDIENKHACLQSSLFVELTESEKQILSVLSNHSEGIHINELSINLNKPYSAVSSLLLEMEFKGLLACLPGGVYRLISK